MQQRQLRLGDILDDYCPRERRVTNHAVVAMIGDDVKQTRCTTCDADHEYKHAKVPRQRRKTDTPAALYAQVLATGPKRVDAREPPARRAAAGAEDASPHGDDEPMEPPTRPRRWPHAAADGRRRRTRRPRTPTRTPTTTSAERADEDGPVHRPLIRASLPQIEGAAAAHARRFPSSPSASPPAVPPTASGPRHPRGGRRRRPAVSRATVRTAAATCTAARAAVAACARAAAVRRRGPAARQMRRHGQAAGSARSSAPICSLRSQSEITMSDLSGKHGLIVGVANKRSISWAIAQAAAAAGARLALTYPSERLEENVRELAATLDNPLVLPCDVAERPADRRPRRDARSRVRRPRLPRARRRVRAGRRADEPVRRDVARGLPHRARRQRLFARSG